MHYFDIRLIFETVWYGQHVIIIKLLIEEFFKNREHMPEKEHWQILGSFGFSGLISDSDNTWRQQPEKKHTHKK